MLWSINFLWDMLEWRCLITPVACGYEEFSEIHLLKSSQLLEVCLLSCLIYCTIIMSAGVLDSIMSVGRVKFLCFLNWVKRDCWRYKDLYRATRECTEWTTSARMLCLPKGWGISWPGEQCSERWQYSIDQCIEGFWRVRARSGIGQSVGSIVAGQLCGKRD